MEENLGRFIKGLKERCPSCSTPLQVRGVKKSYLLRGVEMFNEEEIIQCPNCGYEEKIKNQKKRKMVFDKTAFVKEPLKDNKKEGKSGYNKRSTVKNSHGTEGNRGFRTNNKRSS